MFWGLFCKVLCWRGILESPSSSSGSDFKFELAWVIHDCWLVLIWDILENFFYDWVKITTQEILSVSFIILCSQPRCSIINISWGKSVRYFQDVQYELYGQLGQYGQYWQYGQYGQNELCEQYRVAKCQKNYTD